MIKAKEVLLVHENAEKKGIVSIEEALNTAKSASLDLVQVSPAGSHPVVCKILDYGKYLFDKRRNQCNECNRTLMLEKPDGSFDQQYYRIAPRFVVNQITHADQHFITLQIRC